MLKKNRFNIAKSKGKGREIMASHMGEKATVYLDQAFSWYVRLRDTDRTGWGKCITCSDQLYLTEADCGHFMPRVCVSTRWEPENAAMQCRVCNGKENGMRNVFEQEINVRFPGASERMRSLSASILKINRSERYAMCLHFRLLSEELNASKDYPFVLPWNSGKS